MADPRGLNDDLNIIANTPIPGLDDDLDIISKLDDEPNDVGGLSAAELKARFDQAGLTIQDYINEKLIPAVLGTAAQEAVREANEDQRKANETQRQSQEAARQAQESARQSAESARAAAETGRSGAESGRVTAETGRAGAETTRAAAETARESTENQREAAETARVNAETARVNTESGRVSAESGRAAAEEQRVGAENARAAAETARQDNETARTAAETGRVYAERAREAEQAAFFEGVMAQAATLAAGAQATAEAQPVGESFMVKFGIPRGNKGDKGDKGDTGAGLEVLGIYGTLAALEAAHPAGSAGEAYAVGTAENNAVYVWSGDAWASIGPLRGADGKPGAAGKSAYQYAMDGGYTGTEAQFQKLMGSGPWAPTASPVFTGSISMGRKYNSTVGSNSVAMGYNTTASGLKSHAEGDTTTASGESSHAEGYRTQAIQNFSHAEGGATTASGSNSHAEGSNTKATGDAAHTEGATTTASGFRSHAEGNSTTAGGAYSHAGGQYTTAYNQAQTSVGQFNTEKSVSAFTVGDLLVVGNGTSDTARSNAFRVSTEGVYGTSAFNASGADYAELCEWADGNPEGEDRCGRFVTLDGERIRIAGPEDDYILGIVSGAPSVVGGVHDDQWQGMYVTDIFGRPVFEDVEVPAETDPETGRVIIPAHVEHRRKVNPDYDHTKPYVPRTERPEWDAVGMLGKLVAVDDGTCRVNGWAAVGSGGIATHSPERTRFRVMSRLDESHVRVMLL